MLDRLSRWAGELEAQLFTLWFCRSHPDTPVLAKVVASRQKADLWIAEKKNKPRNHFAAALILAVWAALAYWGWTYFAR